MGYIQRKCNNRVPNQFGDEAEDENAVAAAEADAAVAAKMAKEAAAEVSARYVCLEWLMYALVNIFFIFVNICFT